ncbi:cysteine desulfurase [Candidatus Saccharibacteria bacterium]|nr:cysteine desulfurase [Candidatus Saccharibacteria bacterium]
MIYFDSSATRPLLPQIATHLAKLQKLSSNGELGNPSSLHTLGSTAKHLLETARTQVANLIDATPLEIIFTSGGSEANNTVMHTFKDCPIITSAIEHPSVLAPAKAYGKPALLIPVSKTGIISLSHLESALNKLLKQNPKQKILVSVMLANNETGSVEPVKKISQLISAYKNQGFRKIYLHTDATQAVGKLSVSVKDLGVDYLTFSAHKLGGPVGIGVLFVKLGAPFLPLILGGAQENHRRAGTSNAILASAFGKACSLAKQNHTPLAYETSIRPLVSQLKTQLLAKLPQTIILTPASPQESLPNVLAVSFPAAEGESTQLYLDLAGFAVSTGSACASGDLEPSHVLMAMYHDAEIAHGSVRFSFNLDAKSAHIKKLMLALPPIVQKIESMSTIKKESNVN